MMMITAYCVCRRCDAQVEEVKAIASRHGGHSMYVAEDEEERTQLWRQRKECLWSAMGRFPDKMPMITDVCVPLTELAGLIEQTKNDILQSSLPCPIIAHAGECFFYCCCYCCCYYYCYCCYYCY